MKIKYDIIYILYIQIYIFPRIKIENSTKFNKIKITICRKDCIQRYLQMFANL